MRKSFKILLVFTCLLSSYPSFSWDSEAAKFYPLAVGNQWSYIHKVYGGPLGCTSAASSYNYIITIIKDTIFNGHKYFKFSDGQLIRIDSTSMNVYKFSGNFECKTDSLLARKNDYVSGCPVPMQVIDTNQFSFAGQFRRSTMRAIPGYFRRLLLGIGVYYNGGCDLGVGTVDELNGCIINGVQYGQMLGITQTGNEIPLQFSLSQNYPNPFNPVTNIRFNIPQAGFVKLVIYDVLGNEVQILVNEQLSQGTYKTDFDASALPSGVYYYKLVVGDNTNNGNFNETKKMVLIK